MATSKLGQAGIIVLVVGVVGLTAWSAATPEYETYCTPRTATEQGQVSKVSPQDEIISQDENQTCYRRSVQNDDLGK